MYTVYCCLKSTIEKFDLRLLNCIFRLMTFETFIREGTGPTEKVLLTFFLSSRQLIIQDRVLLLLEGAGSVPAFLRKPIATCKFSKGEGTVQHVFLLVDIDTLSRNQLMKLKIIRERPALLPLSRTTLLKLWNALPQTASADTKKNLKTLF